MAHSKKSLVTTPASLTVELKAGPTGIGIQPPSDKKYHAGKLIVRVKGLPTDGTILLGGSQVHVGEKLKVKQLTQLEFTAGSSTGTSTFTYRVRDPAKISATGTATLAVEDTTPPSVTDSSLSVVENAGPTPIGIAAPTDPNYSASQLTVTVTGLPSDGTVLLADGITPVTMGEVLSVVQLTGLEFRPTPSTFSETSTFSYSVADPSGLLASGTAKLSIAPSTVGTAGIDMPPQIIQPSQTGDIVGVRLQSNGAAEKAGYITFGQVFRPGAVEPTDSLVARINGVDYAVQMDVKSTNSDGSVRQAVLTLDAPEIAVGSAIQLMLAKGTASPPALSAPSASGLLATGYDTTVAFTFHNADGTTTTDTASAAAALQAALNAGTVKNWLSGPAVNEFDVQTTVDGGKLKVEFDIRAYADGTTTTDVIFDNSWMFDTGKSALNYDVSISQGGQQVYSATGVNQYLYSVWHHQVDSAGTISPNIQYDVAYLESTGAIPIYDTSYGVLDSAIHTEFSRLTATKTGPMGTGTVTTSMPTTGARDDIALQPNWVALWMTSQNATAATVMSVDANASGNVPWHFADGSSGVVDELTNPLFWQDPRAASPTYSPIPANGWPTYGQNGDPWQPDNAHMPDLNYVPYLVSGSLYQLRLLQDQAEYAISSISPYYAYFGPSSVNPLNPGNAVYLGVASPYNQARAIAWSLREVAEAAYLTPDTDPLKAYFTTELDNAMNGLVTAYITNAATDGVATYGQIQGFIFGAARSDLTLVSPWMEDYIVTALGEIAGMGIPMASDDAVQMLKFMNNFVSGLYTNGADGYNPLNGPAYWLYVNDPTTNPQDPYTTWSQLYTGNLADYSLNTNGWGLSSANPTMFPTNYAKNMAGGYAITAKAALADEITYTQSPQAIQAYGFVVSQTAYVWSTTGGGETAAWQADPLFNLMPRLPDGVYLPNSQMQIDTSTNNVTLTAQGGDSLLSVVGGGTDTLIGGSGACDLLFGGSGTDTLKAGAGNDYLFGGWNAVATTFVDNTGNDYYKGGAGSNTYVFAESSSGHDTIANFNTSTDVLQIGSNLNGNGITTASQIVAGATVKNGDTILHLGASNDITLLGITTPSSLTNAILVS